VSCIAATATISARVRDLSQGVSLAPKIQALTGAGGQSGSASRPPGGDTLFIEPPIAPTPTRHTSCCNRCDCAGLDLYGMPGLAKARPEVVYEFDWRTDDECQEFARDHLLADRVKGWANALAYELTGLEWALNSLPKGDERADGLRRRHRRAVASSGH
jgi:hypothetical protein